MKVLKRFTHELRTEKAGAKGRQILPSRIERQGKRKAFTLIELLVVVAIIAILAALLLPVLARAREYALLTECISKQKQFSIMSVMYADEYDGRLPPRWVFKHNQSGTNCRHNFTVDKDPLCNGVNDNGYLGNDQLPLLNDYTFAQLEPNYAYLQCTKFPINPQQSTFASNGKIAFCSGWSHSEYTKYTHLNRPSSLIQIMPVVIQTGNPDSVVPYDSTPSPAWKYPDGWGLGHPLFLNAGLTPHFARASRSVTLGWAPFARDVELPFMGKGNMLFYDGHVRTVDSRDNWLRAGNVDPDDPDVGTEP